MSRAGLPDRRAALGSRSRCYAQGMSSRSKVLALALALPEGDRAAVAQALLGSLGDAPADDEGVAEAWRLEIEARLAEIDAGRVALEDGDAFLAELDALSPR